MRVEKECKQRKSMSREERVLRSASREREREREKERERGGERA